MKIKNKYTNEVLVSDLLVENNDCFSKTILKDCKGVTVTYHKNFWEKEKTETKYPTTCSLYNLPIQVVIKCGNGEKPGVSPAFFMFVHLIRLSF